MMIISASRRTDIPAHYGRWFVERLRCGYVDVPDPFNRKQVRRVDLSPEKVDTIVFWTKDPSPFIKHLDTLDDRGYNYYFQYTVNNYPEIFEPGIPPFSKRMEQFRELSRRIGKERVVLRYDPIIISERTGLPFHERNLRTIRDELSEQTDTLVISFLDVYRKISARLRGIEKRHGINIVDVHDAHHHHIVEECVRMINALFKDTAIGITTCSEPFDLEDLGIEHGSCIDISRINRIFDKDVAEVRDKGQRPYCLCNKAVDIGEYNTCLSMCTYCYAVGKRTTVMRNFKRIADPDDVEG
ncbi:MAG: DUF1848 domain-containing protein [Thermoplasmatota archaeon]